MQDIPYISYFKDLRYKRNLLAFLIRVDILHHLTFHGVVPVKDLASLFALDRR